MGIFGTKKETPPPHPRREPRYAVPLTADGVAGVFGGCADLNRRTLYLNNDPARQVEMLFIAGQVRNERACDYVLRPLAQNQALRESADMDAAFDLMLKGGLYSLVVQSRDRADQVIFDLIDGAVALFFPGKDQVLTLSAATEEKRSVSNPENEPDVKGARDSFVESLRTNTSLVRRRFRAPELRVEEQIVGRQSVTPVDVLYVEGIADPDLAAQVKAKVGQIDIDALLMTGNLEQYVTDESRTAFPLTAYTERGCWWTASPWGGCSPPPWTAFSAPGRTGAPAGRWRGPCRCCGMCVCSSPCSCRGCTRRRCCSTPS